jgi:hypothetical protein
MGLAHSPSIVTNGLVFYYDMNNYQKSWNGVPTTNLVGDGMSIYNNVPGDVSASLVTTGEYYRGAPIYKLTLTPTTSTGVSYLTAGGNPGIGVVSGGGGGTANRYTGHAIFYRSTVSMHSTPLYTNYSNISGWGAGSLGLHRSVNMGDGWYRGEVLWYDTVTRSDGKYWAINPAGATLNVPIHIFWAGPFKEDRNDSAFVSPYVPSTRSTTQALLDLTNGSVATVSNLTYNSDNTFNFTYSNPSYITVPLSTAFNKTEGTMDFWVYPTRYNGGNGYFVNREDSTPNAADWFWIGPYSDYFYFRIGNGSDCCSNDLSFGAGAQSVIPLNTWTNMCFTWKINSTSAIYKNGILYTSRNIGNIPSTNPANNGRIGLGHANADDYFHGKMPSVSIYNRQLSASEVFQNFSAKRGIYGI